MQVTVFNELAPVPAFWTVQAAPSVVVAVQLFIPTTVQLVVELQLIADQSAFVATVCWDQEVPPSDVLSSFVGEPAA
jgi:hypothetical protein